MNTIQYILVLAAAYFIGAVPFGFLIARSKGIDLRKVGSGNIGATNLGRALGKKWAVVCFFLDVAKGLIPVLAGRALVTENPTALELLQWMTIGCAAVLGHIYPVYIGFKGGKGVATSLGFVLGIWPYLTIPGFIGFAVWLATLKISHYVSLSSILAAIIMPIILACGIIILDEWKIENLWPLIVISTLMAMLITYRHRDNLKRIAAGTETRVFEGKEKRNLNINTL
ncbi:G3P acyltransferase [Limihaloglobus sulfuriphilus]|uniref:Glycerol-3-phosphate acyltransferase n=1 Tax=Limihaloglobus sulfuriphilus TaxID=1851148 RepID=A0A1Q2MGB6_9BACT|nr:glycerol-3-phosphate 1-O-acyltransferase PlsY [Limihaloglobus sulfuriphilus]AQQ71322.1 G3P acyltransferase [Limihaloglobus sulfuriphilus]